MIEQRPRTCEWTDRCVGQDETPEGRVAVLAIRKRGTVTYEPVSGPVQGAALAIGLTERESWVRRIQTPLKDKAKGLGVLPGLLDVQLPFGIEECVFQCVGAERQAPAGWSLLAAVARESELKARLERGVAEGMEPHHVDQESLALWTQALTERPASPDERRAVVYLGEDRSVLVFGRGEALLSTHSLKRFEAAQAQRLARLVFEGGAHTVNWIWAGPLAGQPDRVEGLVRELDAGGRTHTLSEPRAVLARAYALRALTPGPLRCDFRQGEWIHPDVRQRRDRQDRFSAAVWLAAGLILLAAGLAWRGLMAARESELDHAIFLRAKGQALSLDPQARVQPGLERRGLEQAWAPHQDERRAFSAALSPPVSRGLGRFLMAAREGKVVLHKLDWNEEGLRVEGTAPTAEAADRLRQTVEREQGLSVTVKLDPKKGHDAAFVLEGRYER